MTYEVGKLVCVLLQRWKNVSFFCGRCGGTGYVGTGSCFQCDGAGIREERLRHMIFGGIGLVTGLFTSNHKTTYTVIYPYLSGILEHTEQNHRLVMDMSLAFWKKSPDGKDATTGTVTIHVMEEYVFASFDEAIKALPSANANVINEGIKSHGGMPGIFDEFPSSTSKMKKLRPPDDVKPEEPKPECAYTGEDKLWAVEYRGNVHAYFKCPRCVNEVINTCIHCHGSGKVVRYIPKYIMLGMVSVTGKTGAYVSAEFCPSPYVNDESQITMSRSYWKNKDDGYDTRPPKKTLCTWEHLFYDVEDAKKWLVKKNTNLLEEWCRNHNNLIPEDGVSTALDTTVSKQYPKAVPIEACLC